MLSVTVPAGSEGASSSEQATSASDSTAGAIHRSIFVFIYKIRFRPVRSERAKDNDYSRIAALPVRFDGLFVSPSGRADGDQRGPAFRQSGQTRWPDPPAADSRPNGRTENRPEPPTGTVRYPNATERIRPTGHFRHPAPCRNDREERGTQSVETRIWSASEPCLPKNS